jgi:hypothetical protein
MKILGRNKTPMSVVSGDKIILCYDGTKIVEVDIDRTYVFEEGIVLEAEEDELLPGSGRALVGAFVEAHS